MRCPRCWGKMQAKGQRVKGGRRTYRCRRCKRRYVMGTDGRWKEIA